MLIFEKKVTVVSNPSPPLAYPLYAFINVDDFERPLKKASNHVYQIVWN